MVQIEFEAGLRVVALFSEFARSDHASFWLQDLPALMQSLAPHAAALLSVVPETFSYTLSEMKQMGIPVIATKVGSLAERIEDGKDGWLIEPSADALVARVKELAAERSALSAVRD